MSFGRLGALGRGFGRMGGGGKTAAVIIPGVLTAQTGTFTLTGNAANLVYSRLPLTAAVGTFTLTGNDATLTYTPISGGSTPTYHIYFF